MVITYESKHVITQAVIYLNYVRETAKTIYWVILGVGGLKGMKRRYSLGFLRYDQWLNPGCIEKNI